MSPQWLLFAKERRMRGLIDLTIAKSRGIEEIVQSDYLAIGNISSLKQVKSPIL
jgi:hypothetical protein